jgi:hypothetical protein
MRHVQILVHSGARDSYVMSNQRKFSSLRAEFVDPVIALHTLLMMRIVHLDFAICLAFVPGRKLLFFFHRKRLLRLLDERLKLSLLTAKEGFQGFGKIRQ